MLVAVLLPYGPQRASISILSKAGLNGSPRLVSRVSPQKLNLRHRVARITSRIVPLGLGAIIFYLSNTPLATNRDSFSPSLLFVEGCV